MSDITGFLLARIAEDEDAARASIPTGGRRAGKTFWQRRVAECGAKRALANWHVPDVEPEFCATCEATENWPCSTIKMLSSVYFDHPDYDPAWS